MGQALELHHKWDRQDQELLWPCSVCWTVNWILCGGRASVGTITQRDGPLRKRTGGAAGRCASTPVNHNLMSTSDCSWLVKLSFHFHSYIPANGTCMSACIRGWQVCGTSGRRGGSRVESRTSISTWSTSCPSYASSRENTEHPTKRWRTRNHYLCFCWNLAWQFTRIILTLSRINF